MEIPDHLTCLLRNLYADQEATVRTGHGTMGLVPNWERSVVNPVYCYPAYLTYMQCIVYRMSICNNAMLFIYEYKHNIKCGCIVFKEHKSVFVGTIGKTVPNYRQFSGMLFLLTSIAGNTTFHFYSLHLPLFPELFQFSSVAQSCPTLCDPMNHSTPGLPVHHQLAGYTQTHVHRVDDAIQPSHPLSPPSPPALNLSQHQGLFQ